VIVYPGATAACYAVSGESLGAHGWSFACKPYSEIQDDRWEDTLEFDGRTTYLGIVGDDVERVVDQRGASRSHRVVTNVYSFTTDGPPSGEPLQTVRRDGSRGRTDVR
jgi:hypothetical protein